MASLKLPTKRIYTLVFGIWVTSTYLSPAASIAPGCYMLWQNVVNSWQIYYRETRHLTYTDKM